MEYPNIQLLVPEGEPFDSEAVGEGIWLSAAHMQAIESSLAQQAADMQQLREDQTAYQTLIKTNKATQDELDSRNARIAELEAEVKILGATPSGNGTVTLAKEDPQPETVEVPSYLQDESPINQWVDRRMKRK